MYIPWPVFLLPLYFSTSQFPSAAGMILLEPVPEYTIPLLRTHFTQIQIQKLYLLNSKVPPKEKTRSE